MNIFDFLKEIISEKRGNLHLSPLFSKEWDSFMMARYLSMDKRFENIAECFSQLYLHMNSEQAYLYLLKAVPYHRNSFIRYISKPKK